MAGTLVASNINDGTSTGNTTDMIKGSARAWVNFNGTGTVAISAAYNVSSITDNGVGDYTVNFTTAMVDNNYGTSISRSSFPNNIGGIMGEYNTSTTTANIKTPSNTRILVHNGASSSLQDDPIVSVQIFR